MDHEIVCTQIFLANCGFRAPDRYFADKPRFAPGVCPRCGNPVTVVEKGTNNEVATKIVSLTDGRIVDVTAPVV